MKSEKSVQHLRGPRAENALLDKEQNHSYQALRFTGTAGDYFGIWIVNILLTVVTLGIYSAWAKVRRRRYFQGHTILDGHGFGYHASGKQILLGRLIVVGMMVLIAIPFVGILVSIAFFFLLPLFYHRSLRFNARMTSYRNVRFNFVGTVGAAYKAFLLGPIISMVSFGVLMPIATQWQQEYIGNGMMYGDRPFLTKIPVGRLYRIWLLPFIATICLVIAYIALIVSAMNGVVNEIIVFNSFLLMILYVIVILTWMVYAISVRNIAWSSTLFDGKHPIRSTLGRWHYIWILFSNSFMSIITLGLMRPWAAVRLARFMWENTAICFTEDIGEVVSSIEKTTTPIAAEYLDLEGFDFGF